MMQTNGAGIGASAPQDPLTGLIARLQAQHGFSAVDADSFAVFASQPGDAVVLLTDDPVKYPETWDVGVVLPEVLKACGGRFRAAVAGPEASKALQPRFGFSRWPACVFLREGQYVGVIEGMLDWDQFLPRVAAMLDTPVSRAPSLGIPVRSAEGGAGCH